MLDDQTQEFCTGYRSIFHLSGLAITIAEDHLTVFTGHDVLLLNHAALEIATQVGQRLFTGTHRLTVDHPVLGIAVRQIESDLGDRLEQLGAKDLR
jgi:hypothetical protein